MKKLRFVVLFLCAVFTTAQAQQSTFRINYDVALLEFPVASTEAVTSGNYVFSGFHLNFFPIVSSLSEVNATGNIVWAKRYSDASLSFMFGDVKKDATLNRYYVCGGSDSGPAFLLFIDATGNLISGRRFAISQASGAHFNRVIKTSDGGYVCVGYVTGYDPDGAGPEVAFTPVTHNPPECSGSKTEVISSPLIVKFDASGNHLWHHVFRYYVTSVTPANRIYNDASFVDVVEVSDGYIAVGSYDVNNVFSVYDTGSGSSCGEDRTPTDAMFLKTSTAGAITWHRQIDNPSNSTTQTSKSFASISKTATGLPLISGSDGSGRPAIFMRLPGSGGWASPTWIRKYGAGNLFGSYYPFLASRFFETSDGNYAAWLNYIPLTSFTNVLMKIDASSSSTLWAKQHNFNMASILPHGQQASDGGYYGVSYTMTATGHDMHFMKTDANGDAPSTCAATNLSVSSETPSYTWGIPLYGSWNANTVTNTTITPTVTNITPSTSIQCIQTVCTPPSAPTTVTATPNPICAGQSTTITASGGGAGNTYNVFANATGGTALGATPYTVSPASTTTYYVETVLGTDPTCVSTTRTAVTVTVTPTNTTTGPVNQTICVNVALSPAITHTTTGATGIGAATGLPPGLTASFASNTITISGTPTATGTFNYTIPLTGGCGTVNATGTITVISNNTVTGPFTNTVCINAPINPVITHTTGGATGIGAATGLPPGVTASWASNTITISGTPTATGTFNYTIPLTGGCGTVSATGTIIVNPNNTVSGSANASVCINTPISPTITLTTTGATGIGAASGLPAGVSAVWASNTITISGTPTVAGTFNYTIPLTGGCGTVNATGTITVNPDNTVSGSTNTSVCINTPISPTITLTTTGATGIGTASGLPAGVSAVWNSNTITISGTPTATGTFNYTIPLTGGCGTVNATGTITVNPENTVTGTSSATVCVNTPISPTITLTTTGATGIGAPSGLPAGVSAVWNSNTITISGTPTATGTFNYTIPLTGGCGSISAIGTITVISVNTVTGPVTATACIGSAISPAITHTTGGATGIGAPSGLPPGVTALWNSNTITISGTPTATGTFNYTIPLTGGCGTVNATGTITVNPSPTPIISGDTIICLGETTVLSTGNFSSYDWSNGGQTQSISVSPTSNTTYTVIVADANGCSGTASVNVTVNPLPIVSIGGNTSLCNGQSTTLTASGGGSYVWSNGDNTSSITVTPTIPTSYTVVVTNNNGCVDSATVNVSVFQQPTALITGATNMCSGQQYVLTASGGLNYLWNTGDTTSSLNVSITADTSFIVTVSNGSCSDSDTINVSVSTNPTASAGTDVIINQTQTATLTATGGGSYLWTPSTGLDCDTCATVNAKPLETTTYCVTVTDANACRDSACVKVTLDFICGEIFIPTIFSPNDDGNNDNMCVLGNCVQTLNFKIYSRWGEKVFETSDPKVCWDGTYKGKILNTGVFVFVLEAVLTDGTIVQENGNFTLVR